MAIPNKLDNYLCHLAILCTYVETQNPDVNVESKVYYRMSVDRSLKILGYIWIVAARRRPTVA